MNSIMRTRPDLVFTRLGSITSVKILIKTSNYFNNILIYTLDGSKLYSAGDRSASYDFFLSILSGIIYYRN